jgi:glyoxylase-like metal-dependent hydrolase (beta-lactamase superfamily II)
LLTHGHFDHICDTPVLAQMTGTIACGTEPHLDLVRSLATRASVSIDEEKLSLLRRGAFRVTDM